MTNHIDHLQTLCDLSGKDVIDIGAGKGDFARQLATRGARVTGVEIEDEKVRLANEKAAGAFEMREGRGEALPVDDASQDIACFMFSFHHVPQEVQDDALNEVRRVLRPGGRLHVVDPRPFGSMLEVVKFVDDETEVRTLSQARLDALTQSDGFELLSKEDYVLERRYPGFRTLVEHVVFVDPDRAARLPEVETDMRDAFMRLAERDGDAFVLEQPCVAYHFQRVAE